MVCRNEACRCTLAPIAVRLARWRRLRLISFPSGRIASNRPVSGRQYGSRAKARIRHLALAARKDEDTTEKLASMTWTSRRCGMSSGRPDLMLYGGGRSCPAKPVAHRLHDVLLLLYDGHRLSSCFQRLADDVCTRQHPTEGDAKASPAQESM